MAVSGQRLEAEDRRFRATVVGQTDGGGTLSRQKVSPITKHTFCTDSVKGSVEMN